MKQKTLIDRMNRLSWYVTLGLQFLDDRGRIQDYKCWMTEKQARYFEKKNICCRAFYGNRSLGD